MRSSRTIPASHEQLLAGIWIIFRESIGCRGPFRPEQSFITILRDEGLYEELDFAAVGFLLRREFGTEFPEARFYEFLSGGGAGGKLGDKE